MPYAPFVPLRVFSAFTMLEGAIEPKKIPVQAKKLGFPAIAMCDRNGLYGVMAFQDACKSEGVQPIIGVLLAVARPDEALAPNAAPTIDWLALYAQNDVGYENLCALVSHAHLDRPLAFEAHIPFADLAGRTDGLLCLTGAGDGALTRLLAQGQGDAAAAYCDRLQALFPDRLYIELARRSNAVEDGAEGALIDLAYDRDLPLVATNPACFAEPNFHQAHDAMLCIADGAYVESADRRRSDPQSWIKTDRAMREAFIDVPEAIANTLVIAQRCAVLAPKRKPILPSLAGDLEGEAAQLRADAAAGLDARLATYTLSPEERQVYDDRLKFECDIIVGMGFPGYFLIVADFIKWAKEQGIPVGPGRGSGAGSLVAWALTITDLDPIELGLLFERFLNPERVSMPDFDIDFCETRRGEVIRYVQQKYGRDHVAQIITFGKLKARAVLRDTGRVLQMPYGQVDRLCKLVPNHPTDPWDLDRSMKGVPELRYEIDRDPQVARLFNLARQLEGFPRHSSTHAAGVVIGDRPLDQLVPLYRDPRSDMPVTQFDMKYVETAGLVKFDFLGLKTLSVLRKALDLLARRGIIIDLDTLPRDDEAVYALLKRGDTVGVFQLESEGMRRTLSAVKPTNFGDIIALVSLYRPGPMDNIPMFGRRKNGEEAIEWPHELLAPILSETYGIFVYQEQVMQAAQILAGYSLGDADLLRRAMGKKVQAEMDAQRGRFVDGCAERDIPAAKANELFDLIDKFAGYGFNKSHAAAYALLAYQTAWLKAHYPHEFFAASMCFDMHQTDKLSIFIDDMRRSKVACLPPCVNHSEAEYHVEAREDGTRAVRYALAGLKNVGEKAMEQLVAERTANGPFTSIEDFAGRIDPTLINKRSFENLAAAGAFDGLYPNRAALVEGADVVLATAQSARDERASGQGGLFGEASGGAQPMRLPSVPEWSAGAQMAKEKEAFGFYFAAHPVSQFRAIAMAKGAQSHADLMLSGPIPAGERRPAIMAVLVENVRWRDGKRSRFAMGDFSDESGQFTATCFDDAACEGLVALAADNACALLRVELDMREGDETPRVSIRGAEPLAGMTVVHRLRLVLEIEHETALLELAATVAAMRGGHGELVALVHTLEGEAVAVRVGSDFDFTPESAQILDAVNGLSVVAIEPIRVTGGNGPRPRRHLKSVN